MLQPIHNTDPFWQVALPTEHRGFAAIRAILGDENNLRRVLDAVGGLIELQDLIADLAAKGEEWDAAAVLREAGCEWLQNY